MSVYDPFLYEKGAVKPKRFPDAERSSKKPIYYAVLFEACKNIVKLEERAWWSHGLLKGPNGSRVKSSVYVDDHLNLDSRAIVVDTSVFQAPFMIQIPEL